MNGQSSDRCRRTGRTLRAIGITLGLCFALIPAESLAQTVADANTVAGTPQAEERDEVLAAKVAELRRQLDDDQVVNRVSAEQELLELGPAVLPYLEPANSSLSSEQFDRLNRIRQRLEKMAAESQSRPSRVTLTGAFTLDEALQAIEKQTGNVSQPSGSTAAAVRLELDDVTFWEAIGELEQAFTDTRLDPYRQGEMLRWTPREQAELMPSSHSGPFRFDVVRMEVARDFVNPALSGISVTLRVRWEPRLQPISVSQDLESLSVTAGDEVLASAARSPRLESLINGNPGSIDLTYVIRPPTQRVDKLTDWIGSLTFTIPSTRMPFEFDELTTRGQQESRTGSTVVAIAQASPRDELFGVEVRIRFDESAGSLESHRGWIFKSPVRLVDADGKKLNYFTYETTLRTENEVGVLYLFPLPESTEDLKLIYEVPSAILRVPVSFTIPELKLP
ncbi:MAG: hypothetical protein R3B96_16350 [Pirellulaceae bacterium]